MTAPDLHVITLTYVRPLEEVDALRDAHMEHVRAGFAQDLFVAAGAQGPRTGGVILSRGTRETVESYAAADPFVVHGVAEVAITTFRATSLSPNRVQLEG